MTSPAENEHRSTFASTTGGVMTEEAGAITGELELSCRPGAGQIHAYVRYFGADEWYTVAGGPVATRDDVGGTLDRIVRHLRTPGPVVDGNESAVTLNDLSSP